MLQIIAIITMFLDHLGFLFSVPVLRFIGRVSMPIYAYLLSVSVYKCSDLNKFTKKLFILGFISQIPYYIFVGDKRANIIFSWFFCAILIYIYNSDYKKYIKIIFYCLVACCLLGGQKYDYGMLAVLWFLFFYIFFYKKKDSAFFILGVIVFLYIVFQSYIELFSLLSLPVIILCRKKHIERIKNITFERIYKYFYPAHLVFLDLFKVLAGSSA